MVNGLNKDKNFYPNKEKFLRLIKRSSIDISNLSKAHIELIENIENFKEEKTKLDAGERLVWFYYSDTIYVYGTMVTKLDYTPIKTVILEQLQNLDKSEYPHINMYFIKSQDIISSIHH